MSKELTEKFMNDELDDRLYYFTQKMSQDNVEIGHSFAFNMVRADDGEYLDWFLIHEVLAPVPTYDKVKEMSQKIARLEFDNDALEMALSEGKEINAELVSKTDELVQKMHILEKQLSSISEQLKEARHTIYRIASTDGSDCKTILETIIRDANLYLEKWGVE